MIKLFACAVAGSFLFLAMPAHAQPAPQKKVGYDNTPLQPNGKWRVHDGNRPLPAVITPGTFMTPKQPGKPPSDAIVLLGGAADADKWVMREDGKPITWKVGKDGVMESGKGWVRTKDEFTDFQLHVEWASPKVVQGESQGRGNSGVFLPAGIEIQVLDSYQNVTYPDGQAGALYGQYPPLVNASAKPGEWQVYDIAYFAPRFKDGKLDRPAVVTVFHNGVVVHHATSPWGPTEHRVVKQYAPGVNKGPIMLQDHGNPVRFRNIWLRPLKAYDEP